MGQPGRPEQPLDPRAGPVQRFAVELRELRRAAGSPAYRELAARTGGAYSAATLSRAAGGVRLPALRLALAYVQACGGDHVGWAARWRAVAAEVQSAGSRRGPTRAAPARETSARRGRAVADQPTRGRSPAERPLLERPVAGRSWRDRSLAERPTADGRTPRRSPADRRPADPAAAERPGQEAERGDAGRNVQTGSGRAAGPRRRAGGN